MNTIDFSYVFANMGFTDNLTVYMALIVITLLFVCFLIWSRFKDGKDEEKVKFDTKCILYFQVFNRMVLYN